MKGSPMIRLWEYLLKSATFFSDKFSNQFKHLLPLIWCLRQQISQLMLLDTGAAPIF